MIFSSYGLYRLLIEAGVMGPIAVVEQIVAAIPL